MGPSFVFFLQASELEQEFVSQMKWLATLSLLLWGMVLFYLIFRLRTPSNFSLKPYEAYLGYYVYPYPELHSEIIQEAETFRKQLRTLLSPHQKIAPPSLLQAVLLELAWLEGQIYRFHQPHLRLKQTLPAFQEELAPHSFEAMLTQQLTLAHLFFEKRNALFQELNEKISIEAFQYKILTEWPLPPEEPFPETLRTRFSTILPPLLDELLQIQKQLRPCLHKKTQMGEWIVMQEGSAHLLEKNGLQCFHCVEKDFHTLEEAAQCHPFPVNLLLPQSLESS